MDEETRKQVALFRFTIIGPLINSQLGHGELKQKIHELSMRVFRIPGTRRRRIGKGTIAEWLLLYRKHGFDGLMPKERNDKGRVRRMPEAVLEKVVKAKRANPRRAISLICYDLYKNGEIDTPNVPASTIYRYLSRLKILPAGEKKEQKRYEARFANETWQSDVMHGPYLPHKKGANAKRTYLFAILDDASRLIVGAAFYPSEKLIHLKHLFRTTIETYGVPRKLYVDNGKIFKAHEMEIACAKINTILIYATPYYPEGKGKIERFFRSVRDRFLTGIKKIKSLDELNGEFNMWLIDHYNKKPHSGIDGETPLNRYLRLADSIRRLPGSVHIEELFYQQGKRQVGKDATFRVNNILYEAPEHLIGCKIDVFFDSDQVEKVAIAYHGKNEGYCKPVNFLDNARIKRKPIDYDKLNPNNPNKEDDDDTSCVLA
jgi:putative transposase